MPHGTIVIARKDWNFKPSTKIKIYEKECLFSRSGIWGDDTQKEAKQWGFVEKLQYFRVPIVHSLLDGPSLARQPVLRKVPRLFVGGENEIGKTETEIALSAPNR